MRRWLIGFLAAVVILVVGVAAGDAWASSTTEAMGGLTLSGSLNFNRVEMTTDIESGGSNTAAFAECPSGQKVVGGVWDFPSSVTVHVRIDVTCMATS